MLGSFLSKRLWLWLMGPFPTFIQVENWQGLTTAAGRKSSQVFPNTTGTWRYIVNDPFGKDTFVFFFFLGIRNCTSFCLDVGWLLNRQRKKHKNAAFVVIHGQPLWTIPNAQPLLLHLFLKSAAETAPWEISSGMQDQLWEFRNSFKGFKCKVLSGIWWECKDRAASCKHKMCPCRYLCLCFCCNYIGTTTIGE